MLGMFDSSVARDSRACADRRMYSAVLCLSATSTAHAAGAASGPSVSVCRACMLAGVIKTKSGEQILGHEIIQRFDL
jgi:hypothetical protein